MRCNVFNLINISTNTYPYMSIVFMVMVVLMVMIVLVFVIVVIVVLIVVIIVVIVAVIVGITVVMALIMGWIGITIMSFLYGVDFEQFRGLVFIMLAAGGVTACIDFLYQVVTVLRQQRTVTKLYLITFGFSLFVPILLVNFTGLPGAIIGYLIVMCILLVLLVWEYGKVRMALAERDKQAAAAHATRVVGRVVPTEDAPAEREGARRAAHTPSRKRPPRR